MRCNPSLWLLGVIPIAALSWIAVQVEHDDIESDLARRTNEALRSAGLTWTVPHFYGRDAVLTGKAPDDRDPERASDIVRTVWGVRVANDRSELIERVANFRWSARLDGGRVTLSGDVPSEETRRSLLDAAQSLFPGAKVSDAMRLARGSFDRDTWLAGAKFSLKTLAGLKRGQAELAALDLSIGGEAATADAYRDTRAAVAKRRPSGIGLASENITLPVVHPFTWSARKTGSGLAIAGFAQSDDERDRIAARAKKLFANMSLSDKSALAEGAPEGWSKAVAVSLEQLAQLKTGQASFIDKDLTFAGEAADEQTATAVRRTLKLDVPQNFKIVDKIRYPSPNLAPAGGAFFMGIVNEGPAIELVGMVPSEATQAALVDAVKSKFQGRTVQDRTQVVPNAPEGWLQCVVAGLASLPRLQSGRSVLTDRKLEVTGQTDDYAVSQSVPNDVKAAAGQTCDASATIRFTGQMKSDLSWKAAREPNGMVTLEGDAPDDATRQDLLQTAQQIYAGSSVTDKMKIVGAPAEPWASATRLALQELGRLRHGEVAIESKNVVIKGMAESDQVAKDVRSILATDLPPGFKSRDEITVMSATEKAADSCQSLMRETTAKGTINFERAKADLTPDSSQTLKNLAEIANECPTFSIQIEGHTDAEGTDERNQKLSDRRAKAVADFLAQSGVDGKRLSTMGYGATRPIADNATAEGRAKNRRIEFTVKVN